MFSVVKIVMFVKVKGAKFSFYSVWCWNGVC